MRPSAPLGGTNPGKGWATSHRGMAGYFVVEYPPRVNSLRNFRFPMNATMALVLLIHKRFFIKGSQIRIIFMKITLYLQNQHTYFTNLDLEFSAIKKTLYQRVRLIHAPQTSQPTPNNNTEQVIRTPV